MNLVRSFSPVNIPGKDKDRSILGFELDSFNLPPIMFPYSLVLHPGCTLESPEELLKLPPPRLKPSDLELGGYCLGRGC